MNVAQLEQRLLELFPASDAEPWDHVGLSVGDRYREVGRVACALDATVQNVRRAAERGADVLVTHHPIYLKAPTSFCPNPDASTPECAAALWEAVARGVAVISLHTNLDRSIVARSCLAGLMQGEAMSSLECVDDPESPGLGVVMRRAPSSLEELVDLAARSFQTVPRFWKAGDRPVSHIAILSGSLGDFGELVLRSGVQVVLCGEAGYHVCQDLCLRGCSIVLLGHDASEFPFAGVLGRAVQRCGVAATNVSVLEERRPWRSYREEELR